MKKLKRWWKEIELDKTYDVTRALLQDDKMNQLNNPEQRQVKEKIKKKVHLEAENTEKDLNQFHTPERNNTRELECR